MQQNYLLKCKLGIKCFYKLILKKTIYLTWLVTQFWNLKIDFKKSKIHISKIFFKLFPFQHTSLDGQSQRTSYDVTKIQTRSWRHSPELYWNLKNRLPRIVYERNCGRRFWEKWEYVFRVLNFDPMKNEKHISCNIRRTLHTKISLKL